MPDPPAPPLGNLPGMYYDFDKKRYFPLNAKPTAPQNDYSGFDSSGSSSGSSGASSREALKAMSTAIMGSMDGIAARNGITGAYQQNCDRKRARKADLWDVSESESAARRIRRGFGTRLSGRQS